MVVHCVPHRHLAHAVWEPLAEYAELQQSEQNHTQPKLHPATVRKNDLLLYGSSNVINVFFLQVRLAWLCIRFLDNAVDLSMSPFAKNELLVGTYTPYIYIACFAFLIHDDS